MSLKLSVAGATSALVLAAMFAPAIQPATAASAKFVRCLATPLAVSSSGHGLWGTSERTHGTAINEWQAAVSQQIGTNYANWSNALGGDVSCHRDLFKVICIASATPCRT
jgi:hypothetical protein